jgi:hypothetical protein
MKVAVHEGRRCQLTLAINLDNGRRLDGGGHVDNKLVFDGNINALAPIGGSHYARAYPACFNPQNKTAFKYATTNRLKYKVCRVRYSNNKIEPAAVDPLPDKTQAISSQRKKAQRQTKKQVKM